MRPRDQIYELAGATPLERCTLYLREGGRFELDRHSRADIGGTSTTLKGTYELSASELTLRTEQRVTLEEDGAGDVLDVVRPGFPNVISARLLDNGAEVTVTFQGVTLILARLSPRARGELREPASGRASP